MVCPHCSSSKTTSLKQCTALGYERFQCRCCGRRFNERTGTPFNYLEYTTDVVLLIVRWRLRYKLSLRDLAEMFLERGLEFTYEAVRDWEARFAPLLTDVLRQQRRGAIGPSWYVDETSPGQITHPYRDINIYCTRASKTRLMLNYGEQIAYAITRC